jgi:hypothetical protein
MESLRGQGSTDRPCGSVIVRRCADQTALTGKPALEAFAVVCDRRLVEVCSGGRRRSCL